MILIDGWALCCSQFVRSLSVFGFAINQDKKEWKLYVVGFGIQQKCP
jgi:hypothetical protein